LIWPHTLHARAKHLFAFLHKTGRKKNLFLQKRFIFILQKRKKHGKLEIEI